MGMRPRTQRMNNRPTDFNHTNNTNGSDGSNDSKMTNNPILNNSNHNNNDDNNSEKNSNKSFIQQQYVNNYEDYRHAHERLQTLKDVYVFCCPTICWNFSIFIKEFLIQIIW